MKMVIRHFKVNILPVQNESGGCIWVGLLYIWARNDFILSRAENLQNRNFWKQ